MAENQRTQEGKNLHANIIMYMYSIPPGVGRSDSRSIKDRREKDMTGGRGAYYTVIHCTVLYYI